MRGHRLTLEPVPDVPGGTFSGAKGPMEAHAEDCILVPPDAEAALPREPLSSTTKTLRAEKFLALASASRLPARLSRWSSLLRDAGGTLSSASVSAWPTVARAAALSRAD